MNEKDRNQFVDDLLEASLSHYSSVTPRAGLEGRVLAHSRAAQERRVRFLWAGWLAAGVTAALIVMGVLSLAHRLTIPSPPKAAEVVKPMLPTGPRPSPVMVPTVRAHALLQVSKGQIRQANPISASVESRLPVFPSPSPMTDQEKLLVQYVHTTPAEALSAKPSESEDFQELKIEEIAITPLDAEKNVTQPN